MTPPLGICVPVVLESVRDADTVVLRIPGSAFVWAVRLLNVWAPEKNRGTEEDRRIAHEGKRWLQEKLESADPAQLRLFVELPESQNMLASLSFDRVIGTLYVGDQPINETLVQLGFASSTKKGQLGT